MAHFNFPHISLKRMDAGMLSFELLSSIQNLDERGREMVTSAAQLATFLHQGQTRRHRADMARVPYIEHPMRVGIRIFRWDLDDSEVISAALLHDTVEDSLDLIADEFLDLPGGADEAAKLEAAFEWLSEVYSPQVSRIVELMTVDKAKTYIAKSNGILSRVSHADGMGALFTYASDLVDNAGSLPHQYGHVPDSMVVKLLSKYIPIMPAIINALDDVALSSPILSWRPVAAAAHDHLSLIFDKCENLQAEIDAK